MLDQKDRAALRPQALEQRDLLLDQDRVHAGGGLVEQEDVGVGHQQHAHRQQLLLAAGKPSCAVVGLMLQAEALQHDPGPLLDRALGARDPARTQEQVGEPLARLMARGRP